MDRRSWLLLGVLSALWGASYLFIKVGLRDLSPAMVVFCRTALGAAVVAPLAARRGAFAGLGARWSDIAVLAALQIAAPFMLISVGEQQISSSLTGILVASAPIFTALLALKLDAAERSGGPRLAGILLGMSGVVLLLGLDLDGSSQERLGAGAVLLASLGYALAVFYIKRRFADVEPLGLVVLVLAASAAMTLPPALATLPDSAPGLAPTASVLALGAIGTGLAFAIFYGLIAKIGPARASLVAYIAPGFAAAYGVGLLDERFSAATAAGLGLILLGSWLAAGGSITLRPGRGKQMAPL